MSDKALDSKREKVVKYLNKTYFKRLRSTY